MSMREAVVSSSVNESAISAEIGAATAAGLRGLTVCYPWRGPDRLPLPQHSTPPARHIATATEHLSGHQAFAEAQGVAAVTYTALDVVNNTALAL